MAFVNLADFVSFNLHCKADVVIIMNKVSLDFYIPIANYKVYYYCLKFILNCYQVYNYE